MGVTGVTDGHGTRPTAGVGSGGHAGADALAVVVAGTGRQTDSPGEDGVDASKRSKETPTCPRRVLGGGVVEVLMRC